MDFQKQVLKMMLLGPEQPMPPQHLPFDIILPHAQLMIKEPRRFQPRELTRLQYLPRETSTVASGNPAGTIFQL